VLLHPEGYPTQRGAAPVTLTSLQLARDGIGYVHIRGRVLNPNAFTVQNTTIVGALYSAAGEIVSVGSTVVLPPIPPNAWTTFDVSIQHVPYARYQLFAQAEPE
jgi:hypothetical protein